MSGEVRTERRFDMPPTWDGRPVRWHGWEAGGQTIICPPPPPACCHFCGSMTPAVFNRGSREVIEGRGRFMPSLLAFRCPDCRQDVVWDTATDTHWDLEPDDYRPAPPTTQPRTPAGSTEEATS